MQNSLIFTSLLLMLSIWPIALFLTLFVRLRFVDAYSHFLLPILILAYLLVFSKLWAMVVIFPLLVFYFMKMFENKQEKSLLDVRFMTLSSVGLSVGVFILNLFPKNWHIDTDIILFGNFDIFLLKQVTFWDFQIPVINLILLALLVLNFAFYIIYARKIKYQVILNLLELPRRELLLFSSLVVLNLLVLIYFLGAFLLLGVLSIPFAIALLLARNFKQFLAFSLGAPLLIIMAGLPVAFYLDFAVSQSIVTSLFVTWFMIFLYKTCLLKN